MAKPKNQGNGNGGNRGHGGDNGGKPSQKHGDINAGNGISSAQQSTGDALQKGRPKGADQRKPPSPRTPPQKISQQETSQQKPGVPPKPTTPPKPDDIRHSDTSREHIIHGDGGRQGGHLAGTGFSKKTEFPKDWNEQKILDAAHQVTQQGPPAKGPYITKDANGNKVWAYDYIGTVDGVTVKTTVLADGEIRTSYPPNSADPGVITNPPAPNPAPKGVPMSNPPRYSHPDVGGDGSWTWEGPKGNKIIRIVQDAEGNVTKTELGDYKKK
ncbi:MAG: EndoU domain-containing protein [Saccharomonospora viridis]|jgi:hypothetical protein|uniref:EndoU domain-containing protein n=1 Tax=Saccharomonospora viridis TaxID=1852 RepID=UPI003D8E84B4